MSSNVVDRQLSTTNFCHICCHESDLFCLASCDHPICFECGVRMRIICESSECPICRSDVKTMLVVNQARLQPYSKYDERKLVVDRDFRKTGLKFENNDALNAVRDILAHVCTVCENEPEFKNFDELSQHMRRSHELFYCDLCSTNLQLFSWERKCYNREQLAKHRRVGDPDDRSHRGHPLCEFCDERYMDDEQLYRHLRRDHFICHFCEADGSNKFFPVADEMKKHMKSDHYLCEEGQCKHEPFGIAFRHEIDFKAHKANVHGAKQERLVNLNFDIRRGDGNMGNDRNRGFRDRERPIRNRDGGERDRDQGGNRERDQEQGPRMPGGGRGRGAAIGGSKITTGQRPENPNRPRPTFRKQQEGNESDDPELAAAIEASKANPFALKKEDFPTLNPNAAGSSKPGQKSNAQQKSMADYVANAAGLSTKTGSLDQMDFPSLPLSARGAKQAKKKTEKEQRARRNSRSVSPVKTTKPSNFVMVDDDEQFPSVSEQFKAAEEAALAKATAEEEERQKKAKENERLRQLKTAPTWVGGRSTTGTKKSTAAKSTAWDTPDEAFPALVTPTGPKQQQKKTNNIASKPWSDILSVENKVKEQPKSPKQEDGGKKKKKEVKSPSSMTTDALLEALPPGLPIKSKARRVAQQKQRPSECSEEGAFGNDDAVKENDGDFRGSGLSLMPPPGFERADTKKPQPPPGFESAPSPSVQAQVHQNGPSAVASTTSSKPPSSQKYQYKKVPNFDVRNRALFDRLCALMNNDEERIQEFRKASSEYRRGESDAATYSERIRSLLNDDGAYVRIFSELVGLLPDIQRQNELWEAFRIGTAAIGGGGPSSNDFVRRCPRCGQLLTKIDFYDHAQHAHSSAGRGKGIESEEDYPALN